LNNVYLNPAIGSISTALSTSAARSAAEVFSVEHASLPATCDCGVIVKDGGRFGSLALHHRGRHRRRLRPYAEQVDCLQRSNQQLQQLWGSCSGGWFLCNGGTHANGGADEILDSLCSPCSPARCSAARWQVARLKNNYLRVVVCKCVLLDIICTCIGDLLCCRRVRNRLWQRGQVRRCCVSLLCFTCRVQCWQSCHLLRRTTLFDRPKITQSY
jgi:hypothetical protein